MVLPFIGASIATGIGTLAGLSLGPYIFSNLLKPTSYRVLSEEADSDSRVPAPDHGLLVRTEHRDALPFLEPWVTDPDYERVSMLNRLVATVWPTLTAAIMELVVAGDVYNGAIYPQVKAQVFDKYSFVEDIYLGAHSLRTGKAVVNPATRPSSSGTAPAPSTTSSCPHPSLASKLFSLGSVAPRLGGMRVVPTADDEVLLETSAIWGSTATLDVTVILRFGRLRLVVPLQLANLSFKADVRVVLRPLVEKLPCLGGVSLSLLRPPTLDFSLTAPLVAGGVDLMALPGLPQLLRGVIRVILEPVTLPLINKPLVPGLGLVLPNAVAFPIMPKFGLPDPPVGAVRVTVQRLEGVRGGDDLYCRLEVRRGRFKHTRTVYNSRNPVFEEEFALIVDSLEYDLLRITVFNDDMGWNDTPLSEVLVAFGEVVGVRTDPDTGKEVTDFQRADFLHMENGKAMRLPLKKVSKKAYKHGASSGKSFSASKSLSASMAPGAAAPALAATHPTTTSPAKSPSLFSRIFGHRGAKKQSKDRKDLPSFGPPHPRESSDGDGMPASAASAAAPGGGGGRSLASAGVLGKSPPVAAAAGGAINANFNPYEDKSDDVGYIYFRIEFVPFNKPEYDDLNREREEKSKRRDPHLSMFPAPPGRTLAMLDAGDGGASFKLSYGVLTVQLIRCIDLAPEGAKDLATYVRIKVTNEDKDEEQVSSTILNETSPRWGDRFDFVLIPAASELHIQVFNKTGMLGNLMGTIFRKKEDKDTSMGKVMISVEDVARNGRIKETWSLQDAERGYIELNLSWQTCRLSQAQTWGR